jgi:hypothetical protein
VSIATPTPARPAPYRYQYVHIPHKSEDSKPVDITSDHIVGAICFVFIVFVVCMLFKFIYE